MRPFFPYTIDLAALVEAHTQTGAALTVAATSDARSAGNVSTPVGVFIVSRRALSLGARDGVSGYQAGAYSAFACCRREGRRL